MEPAAKMPLRFGWVWTVLMKPSAVLASGGSKSTFGAEPKAKTATVALIVNTSLARLRVKPQRRGPPSDSSVAYEGIVTLHSTWMLVVWDNFKARDGGQESCGAPQTSVTWETIAESANASLIAAQSVPTTAASLCGPLMDAAEVKTLRPRREASPGKLRVFEVKPVATMTAEAESRPPSLVEIV